MRMLGRVRMQVRVLLMRMRTVVWWWVHRIPGHHIVKSILVRMMLMRMSGRMKGRKIIAGVVIVLILMSIMVGGI